MKVCVVQDLVRVCVVQCFCGYLCSTGCNRVSSMCGFVIVQCVVGVFILSIVRVCVVQCFCEYLCSTGCYRVSSMCGFVIVQFVVGVFVLSIVM